MSETHFSVHEDIEAEKAELKRLKLDMATVLFVIVTFVIVNRIPVINETPLYMNNLNLIRWFGIFILISLLWVIIILIMMYSNFKKRMGQGKTIVITRAEKLRNIAKGLLAMYGIIAVGYFIIFLVYPYFLPH